MLRCVRFLSIWNSYLRNTVNPSTLVMSSPSTTALLHVLKNSGNDVYGLFLSSTSDPKVIDICVPLFHSSCVTVPLVRTALSLVDEIEGTIVGLYFATNNPDGEISHVAKWIHTQLKATLKRDDILVWRYNEDITNASSLTKWPFTPYTVDLDNKLHEKQIEIWFSKDEFVKSVESMDHVIRVADFEDHLTDPSLEWISA